MAGDEVNVAADGFFEQFEDAMLGMLLRRRRQRIAGILSQLEDRCGTSPPSATLPPAASGKSSEFIVQHVRPSILLAFADLSIVRCRNRPRPSTRHH